MEPQKRYPTLKAAAIMEALEDYITGPLPPYGTLVRVARKVRASPQYVGDILREMRRNGG